MQDTVVEVETWLLWVWRAFWHLSHERPHYPTPRSLPAGGFYYVNEPGRIPWTAIDRYGRRYRIKGPAFDFLVGLIGEMDQEYLKVLKEKQEES